MTIYRCVIFACLSVLVFPANRHGSAAPTPEPEPSEITFDESDSPRSLDPHVAGDARSSRHVMHVYETLLEYAPFGECRLQPCLAQELPAYDDEALTYTFKLRDDVFFADDDCFPDGHGRKLTAQDVVLSLKRLAALPDSGGYWVIDGQVEGLDQFRLDALKLARTIEHKDGSSEEILTPEWWKHMQQEVSGLKALDETTVQITLNHRNPQFLMAISLPYGAIVPVEAAKTYDLNTRMVGTGPYVLNELSETELVYERNHNYRAIRLRDVPDGHPLKHAEGSRLPLTDVLRYRIIPKSADSFELFLKGITPTPGFYQDQYTTVIDEAARKAGKLGDDLLQEKYREQGIHLREFLEPTLHYISFNMKDTTFGSPAGDTGKALRAAVALCIDRTDYINTHLNGRGEPADQLIPPGVLGHSEQNVMSGQRFDPAEGRKLLKEAGFTVTETDGAWTTTRKDGKQVELKISFRSTSESTVEYGEWLTNSVAAIGIKLVPDYLSFPKFLRQQADGTGQAYDAGWVMDVPDAQNMLQLLYSPNKPPGINSAAYESEAYDRLYEEMAVLRDDVPEQAKRKRELIKKLHKQIDDDTPWVLMEYRKRLTLYHEGFNTPPPNPFASNFQKYAHWSR